jgi:hypothetical protein
MFKHFVSDGVDSIIMSSLLSESAREKVFEALYQVDGDDSNFLYSPFRYLI